MYKVVLVEPDKRLQPQLSGAIREEPALELVAVFQDAETAMGRSSVFAPDLFLVNVEGAADLAAMPELIRIFPQARVLGFMRDWQADLAEGALKAGAQGCILAPFSGTNVLEALELYKRRGKHLPTRNLAFFSPKGYAGRSTLASILAVELAKASGEAVGLIDADLQFGDLAMFFDVSPEHNVVEAAHDIKLLSPATLEPYFYQAEPGVWLLAGAVRPEHAELVEADRLIDVVRMAGSLFRYVLIDLPAGFNPISLALAEFADTDVLTALLRGGQEIRHMKRSMRMFDMWRSYGKHVYPIFGRVEPCTEEKRRAIEAEFGGPVAGIMPEEPHLADLTSSGRLLKDLPEGALADSIREMAAEIVAGKR